MKHPKISLEVVQALKDSVLYTADNIIQFSHARGEFPENLKDATAARFAMRQLLEKTAMERAFPANGDGTVPGHTREAEPGWYGHRWKAAFDR